MKPRTVVSLLLVCSGMALMGSAKTLRAATWQASNGNASGSWTDTSHWSGGVLPSNSEDAIFNLNAVYTVSMPSTASLANNFNITNSQLTVSGGQVSVGGKIAIGTIGGNGILNLTNSGSIGTTKSCFIGDAGYVGNVYLSSGTLLSSLTLVIGNTGSSQGTLDIPAGAQVNTSGTTLIGSNFSRLNLTGGSLSTANFVNAGTFNWTSGSLQIVNDIFIQSGAVFGPSLVLNNAMVFRNPGYTVWVGKSGAAPSSLVVNAGGAANIYNFLSAFDPGTDATLSIASGVVTANNMQIGYQGVGRLIVTSGGTISDAIMQVGVGPSATGVITVDGTGSSLTSSASLYLGGSISAAGGTGLLNISSGAHVAIAGTVKVWTSSSKINLTGGTFSAGGFDVGGFPSRFSWSGGTLEVADDVPLFSTGTLGSSRSIATGMALSIINHNLPIGGSNATAVDSATLNINGGSVVLPGAVKIWDNGSSVNFSAGHLEAGSMNTTTNISGFNWTGGYLAITATSGLIAGANQAVHQSINPGMTLDVGGTLTLSGTLPLSGGTILAGVLDVGGSPSRFNWSNGTLNLTNSDLTVSLTGTLGASMSLPSGKTLIISGTGHSLNLSTGGTLNLTGGVVTTNLLKLDNGGVLNQSGGAILVAAGGTDLNQNGESIGISGNATFIQTGGTNTVQSSGTSSGLTLGTAGVASGNYLLSGTGSVATQAITLQRGLFSQSGSTSNVSTQALHVGFGLDSNATYNLSGGSLAITQASEDIGFQGTGSFNQSGGTHLITSPFSPPFGNGYLYLGYVSGSSGTYTLTAGTLNATDGEYVGLDGQGRFTQTGGTNTTPLLILNASTGNGIYQLQGGTLSAAQLMVNASSTFNQTGGTFSTTDLTVASGGIAILGSNQNLTNLSIDTTPGSTAKLDVTSHDLIVQNTDVNSVMSLMKTGQLTSSTAKNNPTHLTTLGIITSGTLYGPAKPFDGFIPGPADVLVKYTYYGDANLDGKVDGSDYSRIDSGYLADRVNSTAVTGWYNGDFNYDGTVNGSDYTLIDNAYNTQGAILSTQIATPTALLADVRETAVPEPTSAGLITFGVVSLLGRRRFRR